MKRPRVIVRCNAQAYAHREDRIIEYTFPGTCDGRGGYDKGGLIRFGWILRRGKLRPFISLYRHDKGITIHKGKAE